MQNIIDKYKVKNFNNEIENIHNLKENLIKKLHNEEEKYVVYWDYQIEKLLLSMIGSIKDVKNLIILASTTCKE